MDNVVDIKAQVAAEDAAADAKGPQVSQTVLDSMAHSPEIKDAFLKDYDMWDAETKWFPYFVGWLSCRIAQMNAAKGEEVKLRLPLKVRMKKRPRAEHPMTRIMHSHNRHLRTQRYLFRTAVNGVNVENGRVTT